MVQFIRSLALLVSMSHCPWKRCSGPWYLECISMQMYDIDKMLFCCTIGFCVLTKINTSLLSGQGPAYLK